MEDSSQPQAHPEEPQAVDQPLEASPEQAAEPAHVDKAEEHVEGSEPSLADEAKGSDPAPVEEVKAEEPAPAEEVKAEEPAPAEEVKAEEPASVEEVKVEEPAPVEEVKVPEPAPVEEVKVPEPAPVEEVKVPEPAPVEEVKAEEPQAPVEEVKAEEPAPVEEVKVPEPTPVEEVKVPEPAPVEEVKAPELVNLIKNPNGDEGFDHWFKNFEGCCDEWAIHADGTYEGRSHTFVSSRAWCLLAQRVPIDPSRSYKVTVITYASRRTDSGALAQLRVKVDNPSRKGLSEIETYEVELPGQSGDGTFCTYVPIKLEFSVEEGTTGIEVTLRGKDTVNWGGHYGARFGYTALYLA